MPWFVLWSFFLLTLPYISINVPYGHAWNTSVMSGLMLLVATWICWISYNKRIFKTVSSSLATSLELLVHRQNIARLCIFYRYYFDRCSSELAQLVPFHFFGRRSNHYSDRAHGFFITIRRWYKDVYINSFIPRTTRLWNSLPMKYFSLTYDVNGFNSKNINSGI